MQADPALAQACLNLGRLAGTRGDHALAAECFKAGLDHHPGDPTFEHLSAASAGRSTARAPAGYVTNLFDSVARQFENHLVRELEYQVPEALAKLVRPEIEANACVIDLGCGTGLVGVALAATGARITGVDLSPRMLERAQSRGGYDDLRATDLLEALAQARGRWDLIVAADVLPYMGDLKPVWDRAALALKSGGLFAVSIERAASDTYVLRANGRYAHGPSYVSGLAHGSFEVILQVPATLRTEAGAPVAGEYLLMRKI